MNRQFQPNGDLEVHCLDKPCPKSPSIENRIILGNFNNCYNAIAFARQMYPQYTKNIDGCYYCCNECHTR